jgi:hypothetical protein
MAAASPWHWRRISDREAASAHPNRRRDTTTLPRVLTLATIVVALSYQKAILNRAVKTASASESGS